jgi:hypothetical protein
LKDEAERVSISTLVLRGFWIDLLGVFAVFFLYAGTLVPAINEPHYWTKAAHFWNSDFGKGDLFLESGDAHWLFFATFGALTTQFPLVWSVWIGRLVTWLLLSFGWTALARSLWTMRPASLTASPPIFATSWAALWLSAMHWGHWAGEWVVGGCESKGIAYAFVFIGLACAIHSRWTLAWSMLGIAAAFHVVVGIWVIGSVLIASLMVSHDVSKSGKGSSFSDWFRRHGGGLVGCGLGVAVGVIPALLIDMGTDPKVATESAVKQAYLRLGHHLAPSRFSMERWTGFAWHLLAMLSLLLAVCNSKICDAFTRIKRSATNDRFLGNLFSTLLRAGRQNFLHAPHGVRFVSVCCTVGFAVALVGLTLDWTLSQRYPDLAAKFLRFYWFRWNDVTFAMLSSLLLCSFAYGLIEFEENRVRMRAFAVLAAVSIATLLAWNRVDNAIYEKIPAGDKAHFVAKSDEEAVQIKQFEDWVRVCEWIRNNTDPEGLWLTPRRQQSFKWRTGRPELACWKDAPQNAVALVEWGRRLGDAYRFDGKKILLPMSDTQLNQLQKKYELRYVLLDRRVLQQNAPLLPILYPTGTQINDSFSVFEFPSIKP